MLRPRARFLRFAVALFVGIVGIAVHVEPDQADAAPTDFVVTYPSWGVTVIEGPFGGSVRIPDKPMIVVTLGIENEPGRLRLGIVDTDTYEVTEGPLLERRISKWVVSTNGDWLYVVPDKPDDGEPAEIERYALPSMAFDQRFTVDLRSSPFDPHRALDLLVPVPGAPSRIVVVSDRKLAVYDNGVLIGTPAPGPSRYGTIVMVDETTGFFSESSSVDRFEITAAGPVIDREVIRDEVKRFPLQLFQSRLIFGTMSYPLPSLTPARPATESEYGFADEDLGVSFVHSSDPESGGIYDLGTGEPIVANKSASVGTYLGDGRSARGGSLPLLGVSGLIITNLFDTLGSYGEFHGLKPDRIFDTRSGLGRDGDTSTMGPRAIERVKVHGEGGVPEFGVEAVILNITAVDLTGARSSHIKAWPAGFDPPDVSNLNFQTGSRVGNMVTVATSADGYIEMYQHNGNVDVTVDVMGWFGSWWSESGGRYVPYRPYAFGDPELPAPRVRIIDTRPGDGSTGHASLGRKDTLEIRLPELLGYQDHASDGSISYDDVEAVVLNVAALDPTSRSHIRIFAGGELPEASSMNFPPAQNTARLITAPVAPDGTIAIYNHAGRTDIIVDFVGLYTTGENGQEGRFVGIEPERVINTREGSPFGGDGRMTDRTSITQGGYRQSIYLVANLTIADATRRGYIAAGTAQNDPIGINRIPQWSSLNYEAGRNVANLAIINTAGEGIEIYHHAGRSHLIVDIFGYYTAYRG